MYSNEDFEAVNKTQETADESAAALLSAAAIARIRVFWGMLTPRVRFAKEEKVKHGAQTSSRWTKWKLLLRWARK